MAYDDIHWPTTKTLYKANVMTSFRNVAFDFLTHDVAAIMLCRTLAATSQLDMFRLGYCPEEVPQGTPKRLWF